MHILVTGGTGYIGSHTVVELVQEGHSVVVVDNLVNSSEEALRRVAQIVGQTIPFVKVDLCDPKQVEAFFAQPRKPFDCCMHFAGLKRCGRVGGAAPAVLSQQPGQHDGAGGSYGAARL